MSWEQIILFNATGARIINKNYVEYVDSVNRYIKLRGVKEYVEIGRTMKEKVVNEFSN